MPINYNYSFRKNGKIVFVQNEVGRRIGTKLVDFLNVNVKFPEYYFHYQRGGHVAALHRHIENNFFFRIDFKDFFYSISRNRVSSSLYESGFYKARKFSHWSCVKNPIDNGINYALPIGFVQSPALATLTLMRTNIASVLNASERRGVYVSVYLDDIVGSGNKLESVQEVFADLIEASESANFVINQQKLITPRVRLEAFNCHLAHKYTAVTDDRIKEFDSLPRTELSKNGFHSYVKKVAEKN